MTAAVGSVTVDDARAALRRGEAVVLPNPAPLTCVVAATDVQVVNTTKGRPADQAVALWAHHPDTLHALGRALALDTEATALAHRLLTEERVTLLVPLHPDTPLPGWLAPAARDGWALLFGARWAPLLPVLTPCPVLYVSSANRTGHAPAATAADALAMFPAGTPVLAAADDDTDTGTGRRRRRATTTLRLHPDQRIELHRHGAQDHPYPDPAHYLAQLHARYRPSP
ncbi:hypothetical protein [Kitasatospora mediocidica]|uniref:hypothetical protein n=1 Tax=Kitasatospora mediocidica TaxID=58352 RepID=UPI00068BA69F|nr:hypothetical protein [Kitasatospora mediocidica]